MTVYIAGKITGDQVDVYPFADGEQEVDNG